MDAIKDFFGKYYLQPVYLISMASVLGSLYASEIAHLAPCNLCWWQRICMYPIALISFIAITRKDNSVWRYILPLSLIGSAIGVYHVLLQAAGEGSGLPGCTAGGDGISCAKVDVQLMGFLTIPMLSALSFIAINLCIAAYLWAKNKKAE